MKVHLPISLLLASLFFLSPAGATGPSYILSEMRPVAVNDRGDVLCHTRFEQNPTGSYTWMSVVYGYAILTPDTIRHYTLNVLDYDSYSETDDEYMVKRKKWESIFEGPFRERYLLPEIQAEFGFTPEGLDAFRVDRTISVSEFNTLKNTDLHQLRQQALFGGLSRNNYAEYADRVHILYDFGHIVVLHNRFEESAEHDKGSTFNYTYPWGDERMDYDYSIVTGVLFIDNKQP